MNGAPVSNPRVVVTEPFSFSFETRLAARPDVAWDHATTMDGVNRELAPLVRMTTPRGLQRLDAAAIVPGRRVMRSWILLLGVLPIDYDDVTFVEFEPPRRFLECSPMLSQRSWQHERVVEAVPGGCVVRDTVRFEPRIAWLGRVQAPLFRLAFRHRHRRLARLFGQLGRGPTTA